MKLADFGLAIEVQGEAQAWYGKLATTYHFLTVGKHAGATQEMSVAHVGTIFLYYLSIFCKLHIFFILTELIYIFFFFEELSSTPYVSLLSPV